MEGACLASTWVCTVNVSLPAREIDAFLKGRASTDLEEEVQGTHRARDSAECIPLGIPGWRVQGRGYDTGRYRYDAEVVDLAGAQRGRPLFDLLKASPYINVC